MKIITLASGSKGNCTLISTEKVSVLVDAGISMQEIEQKLHGLETDPSHIYAILVTHEHSDHIKSVGVFARKYGCFVYAHSNEWPVLEQKIGKLDNTQKVVFNDSDFFIKDLTIKSFNLSHDCSSCVGYSFYNQGHKISIATDFGYPSNEVINNLKDSNLIILEANHDENILLNNPKYSSLLKHRILSKKGHISNRTCAGIIRDIFNTNLKQIVLAHLSEENNNPLLAYNTVKSELNNYGIIEGKHLFVDVATQKNLGHLFEIKD